MGSSVHDALLSLRQSIASGSTVTLTTSPDPSSPTDNLAEATHLTFSTPEAHAISLDEPTRFKSSDRSVDLRSIYFAWRKKDDNITDYIASVQQLNDELAGSNKSSSVQNLVFVERLDLITWLEGASDESEYIEPLEGDSAAARQAAQLASGAARGVSTIPSGLAGAGLGKEIDPRLQEIYNLERRMGDRNTVLRGAKPLDFTYVRKYSETFIRDRKKPNGTVVAAPTTTTLTNRDKKSGRRPDPIILLSPSASSLLRMTNIKSFLDEGKYIPPESTGSNILQLTRLLPSIDSQRPFRFILVDTPEQFKPDYWNRVVAVFTTGQTWQFKSYKWQNAPDLFKHALGIYVGWRGEDIPQTVKGWGRGVTSAHIDKWNPVQQNSQLRWRDREVVEGIWDRIEESMRSRGWSKDGGPVER